ncbi:MAG: ABC transporter substrate-binding protein, partial [Ferrovibrio sp.]|nr:ABC transporter substrate-binding protein [Ferrovibrio sp.]
MRRRAFLVATSMLTAAGLLLGAAGAAQAQGRKDTLLVLVENGPNSMDIHGVGTSFRSYVAAWNMYDRLVSFGIKTLPDGTQMYDYSK